MFRKLWAFCKRDWQLALTYRYAFLYELGRTFALFLSFFFIGKLFADTRIHPQLAAYGGNYFRFVFLGIAFSGLMTTALGSLKKMISFELGSGTLEAILLTPTPFATFAIGKVLWDFGLVLVKTAGYLLMGTILFRVDFSQANWFALFPILGLTSATFFGLGLLSAGFFLLTRETSPLEMMMGWASRFLAGVYFPVAVLPDWLRVLSSYLPLTYTLEAARKVLIAGSSIETVGRELTVLTCFSVLLLPLGLVFFTRAFDQARHKGSLGLQN